MTTELTPDHVVAVPNRNYKPDGLRSYLWLLQKYNINPTLEGPYFRTDLLDKIDRLRHGGLSELRKHTHRHRLRNVKQAAAELAAEDQGGATSRAVGLLGRSQFKPLIPAAPTGTTVTAYDQQNDSLYLCPVTIGKQKLVLNFDTGSSDLWVMSTHLDPGTQAELRKWQHNMYDPATSPTPSQPMTGSTWDIEYGDGSSASGDVVTDTLVIGSISVENQAIECAKSLSPAFIDTAGDGLVGLGMGTINTVQPNQVATPVENMIQQQDIPKQLFTAYLSSWKDTDEADQGKSFYTFGSIDQTVMKRCNATDFWYTPLVNQDKRGFWEFSSVTYSVNGQIRARRSANRFGSNTAIADTGTTLMLVDDLVCSAIYGAIKGARYDYYNQGYVFPTNTPESGLPEVGVDVGGKMFFVPKEALLFAETSPGWCYGGIQSRGDLPFDIWGDTWLKGVYACFDHGNKRFGAVQRTLNSQNLSVPK